MRRMRHLKPREIQGCQLALDASIATSLYDATSGGSLVAADGAVARWEDQSGNGFNVTQSTAGARPARRVASMNGNDSLQFDGGDLLAQSAASQSKFLHLAAGSTVICTVYPGLTSNPDNFYAFLGNNGAATAKIGATVAYDDRSFVPRNNAIFALVSGAGTGTLSNNVAVDKMQPAALSSIYCRFDNANATPALRSKIRVNGDAEYGSSTTSGTGATSDPSYALQVGSIGDGTLNMIGYISTVAAWSRVLNSAVCNRMHNAGMRKWRING